MHLHFLCLYTPLYLSLSLYFSPSSSPSPCRGTIINVVFFPNNFGILCHYHWNHMQWLMSTVQFLLNLLFMCSEGIIFLFLLVLFISVCFLSLYFFLLYNPFFFSCLLCFFFVFFFSFSSSLILSVEPFLHVL